MLLNKEKPPLAMAAWALRLEHDCSFRKWHNKSLAGMSLAGMSDLEYEVMTSWCRANGSIHITRRKRFEEFLHHTYWDYLTNLPDNVSFDLRYMEDETVVIGTEEFIAKALRFAHKWPKRKHVCYTTNTSSREIRRTLAGTNYRAVKLLDITLDAWLISTDDREKLFPLWIKS